MNGPFQKEGEKLTWTLIEQTSFKHPKFLISWDPVELLDFQICFYDIFFNFKYYFLITQNILIVKDVTGFIHHKYEISCEGKLAEKLV